MPHLSSLYTRRAELTASARDIARDLAYASDDELQAFSREIATLEHDLTILGGDIEAAEAERRASEWAIRMRYVRTLEVEMGITPGAEMMDDATAPAYFDIDF